MKKVPSKGKIILVASAVFVCLFGGARISAMQRMEGIIDFSEVNYILRIVYPLIVSIVFMTFNLLEHKRKIGKLTIDFSSGWVKLAGNLLLFLAIHFLFATVSNTLGDQMPRANNGAPSISPRIAGLRILLGNAIMVLSAILIAWIYRLIARNYRVSLINERLQKENAESKFEALKNQINPHFLFNAFYTLNGLIDKDTEGAKEFVNNMADVYRYVLESSKQNLVSVEKELAFTEAYSGMLSNRFHEAIDLDISVLTSHKALQIPPLSLQILLENAVKHNVFDKDNPLKIEISSNGKDQIIVKNTFNPRPVYENSSQIGLYNLNQRYKFLSKKEIIIKKTDQSFEVTLPLLDT